MNERERVMDSESVRELASGRASWCERGLQCDGQPVGGGRTLTLNASDAHLPHIA